MKLKTRTCPIGLSGMRRMIVKGMSVRRSRPVRRAALTSLQERNEILIHALSKLHLGFSVYPCKAALSMRLQAYCTSLMRSFVPSP